jgi:hypothetical protein
MIPLGCRWARMALNFHGSHRMGIRMEYSKQLKANCSGGIPLTQ